jgi:hypothetical protein
LTIATLIKSAALPWIGAVDDFGLPAHIGTDHLRENTENEIVAGNFKSVANDFDFNNIWFSKRCLLTESDTKQIFIHFNAIMFWSVGLLY